MHCPKGSLKEEKRNTMQNNKKPYWEAITALLPEYKQPLKLPSRCYSTSVKIQISDERQAGTSLKHKAILKSVVSAVAILALKTVHRKKARDRSNFKNGISHSTDINSQSVKYKALLVYSTKILQS